MHLKFILKTADKCKNPICNFSNQENIHIVKSDNWCEKINLIPDIDLDKKS